jgi:hypothetical protein
MKKLYIIITVFACCFFSCKNEKSTKITSDAVQKEKTILTDENFALAESQIIFQSYVSKIATATNTNGVGVFMHNRKAADPKKSNHS